MLQKDKPNNPSNDKLQKDHYLSSKGKSFLKYLVENISLVFLLILFYEWVLNLGKQVDNIFNIYPGKFSYYLLIGVIGLFAILLFILSVNSMLLITKKGFIESLKKTNLKSFLLKSPSIFLENILDKFLNENKNKFYIPFWVFSGILIIFIDGSPILNNYTGVYVAYEKPYFGSHGSPDGTETIKIPSYVYNKYDKHLVEQKIEEILDTENDSNEDYESHQFENLAFDVSSGGYIFEQTAIIEGYRSHTNSYRGFYDYVSALIYFSLEKFIITIIWVLLPFLICVGVESYRNKS